MKFFTSLFLFSTVLLGTHAKKHKVDICHIDDEGFETISISENALGAHLNHGDLEGSCSDKNNLNILCDDGDFCTIDDSGDSECLDIEDRPLVDCEDLNPLTNPLTNDTCEGGLCVSTCIDENSQKLDEECVCDIGYVQDGSSCVEVVEVGFVDSFTFTESPTTEQCDNWNTYVASLTENDYTKITLSGSLDPVGLSCTEPAKAQALCSGLRTGTVTTVTCGGVQWRSGTDCVCTGLSVSLNPIAPCNCGNGFGYAIRPCNGDPNWGGMGTGSTCFQGDQTINVVCE